MATVHTGDNDAIIIIIIITPEDWQILTDVPKTHVVYIFEAKRYRKCHTIYF